MVSGRTMLVVAAGLSQIGEFSFIVGQAGVPLGVLSQEQYGLILAAALLAIVLNPLLFKAVPALESALQRAPALWRRLDLVGPVSEPTQHSLSGHVVVVGYGRVGEHTVTVLDQLGVPHLIIELDATHIAAFKARGVPTLLGDAANSEVLTHAGLAAARAMVVTIPDETAAELVVAAARDLAPELPIIARAATTTGVRRLYAHGAQEVIHPELEGGLEIVHHTLLALGYPVVQVQYYTDAVRHDAYDTAVNTSVEQKLLRQLIATAPGGDLVGQIGDAAQVQAAAALIASPIDEGAGKERQPLAQGGEGDRPPAPGGFKDGQHFSPGYITAVVMSSL